MGFDMGAVVSVDVKWVRSSCSEASSAPDQTAQDPWCIGKTGFEGRYLSAAFLLECLHVVKVGLL